MDYGYIKKRARELRKNQTSAEIGLWEFLRNRSFRGLKFLRQHPIEYEVGGRRFFFIADFYFAEKKFVLEFDGKVHDFQKERDRERDRMMRTLGLTVLRIKNEEIVDMGKVALKIKKSLKLSISPSLQAERVSGGE